MNLYFSKMQGIGNDYIYIDCFHQTIDDPSRLSVKLSHRNFGIGGDGIILISPSDSADCQMHIFNADGSEAKMCGNGIRCVGKYVYDKGLIKKNPLTVETLSGIKTLMLTIDKQDEVTSVRVNMEAPILKPCDIPLLSDKPLFINETLTIQDTLYHVTGVSMGNPHAVVFTNSIDTLNLSQIGPLFENHPLFPDRVNTEFVERIDSNTFKMRVWERGSGETLACGTGACAVAVAAVLNGFSSKDTPIHILLKGGDLSILWSSEQTVYMEGPATLVFDGTITI